MNHQGAKDHLSRLPDEMPVLVDDPPVSGRSQPRPAPLPPGFAHDIEFWPSTDGLTLRSYLSVRCQPCSWSQRLEGGHSLADLIRYTAQHAGAEDQVTVLTEALLRLCGHQVDDHVGWPHDAPFGTETTPGGAA